MRTILQRKKSFDIHKTGKNSRLKNCNKKKYILKKLIKAVATGHPDEATQKKTGNASSEYIYTNNGLPPPCAQ